MKEVDKFKYLEVTIGADGITRDKVTHMVLEERKVWRTIAKLWKKNMNPREVKRELYERVAIPTD